MQAFCVESGLQTAKKWSKMQKKCMTIIGNLVRKTDITLLVCATVFNAHINTAMDVRIAEKNYSYEPIILNDPVYKIHETASNSQV